MQTRCAGSGEWQSVVGDIGLGFVPFRPPGLPLPHFSQVLWSLFSLCLYPPLFSYAVGVLYQIPGERGEVKCPLSVSFCCYLRCSSFTLVLLVSLLPPSSVFLPLFLFLLMWLVPFPTSPCRQLARWAGASRSCK